MAFKMRGSSMHKGTSAHKKALSSFRAAEETSSMKRQGIYETFVDKQGNVQKRLISADQFESEIAAKTAAGEAPAINMGGRDLDPGSRVTEYVLTADDINRLPEYAQEYVGGDTPAQAPGLVSRDVKAAYFNPGTGDNVEKNANLQNIAAKDKARMDAQIGELNFDKRKALIENRGVDTAELNKFIDTLSRNEKAILLGNVSGSISDVKSASQLDKLLQRFVNQGGKVTKGEGKKSVGYYTSEPGVFPERTTGKS